MKAHAVARPTLHGMSLVVSPEPGRIIGWNAVSKLLQEGVEPGEDAHLRLSEDVARAIYEALAEHFGLAASNAVSRHQQEALDLERRRVDKMLDHLIG